jgi:hypothetical protein
MVDYIIEIPRVQAPALSAKRATLAAMAHSLPTALRGLRITQVALLVPDLAAAVANWSSVLAGSDWLVAEPLIEQLASEGWSPVQAGSGYGPDGDGAFAYYDTVDTLGLYAEVIEAPARRRPSERLSE